MQFLINQPTDVQLHFAFESEDFSDPLLNRFFKGKAGKIFPITQDHGTTIYGGLGKESDLSAHSMIAHIYHIAQEINHYEYEAISVDIKGFEPHFASIVEGFLQSTYRNEKYLSAKTTQHLKHVHFVHAPHDAEKIIVEVQHFMDGVFFARDLINEPAMELYPETLAQRTKEILSPLGIAVDIKDKQAIEALQMKAFLSVARGSAKEPKLIVMRYHGNPHSDDWTGLVGKGLTFDSGGYSLKPSNSMTTMHTDMGGAGTVIGTMLAIAKAELPVNVVGVVAACENLISGDAYKPGDIIGSMAGKTIEIDNTDAEGRVTLADSLYYTATELHVNRIIDLATLTGAVLVALGDVATGAVTNDEAMLAEIQSAAAQADEPIWQLPTFPAYKKLITSKVADLKNTGGRMAGTITAGLFLEEFVAGKPWVHLDIAGTSYLDRGRDYLPQGATGFGVKTLFHYLKGRN